MWKLFKELYYRHKVRKAVSSIVKITQKRQIQRTKQLQLTKEREVFEAKLESVIKEN